LQKPNNRSTLFAKELNTSVKNIERWLKQLKNENKIEFKGSPKTGGYVVI
jgi:ATP-dependent DNA helicase RecG